MNVNTAPVAVLKSLFDDREVRARFFDKIVEYRNLEDEDEKKKEQDKKTANSSSDSSSTDQPQLDEYGQEIVKRKIFDSLAKLSDVDGFKELGAEAQAKLNLLLTTQSNVFSVYVVARRATSVDADLSAGLSPSEMRKMEESRGDTLLRVIHAVYWRRQVDGDTVIVPIVRWEVLDYLPYEVLDFPPDDR